MADLTTDEMLSFLVTQKELLEELDKVTNDEDIKIVLEKQFIQLEKVRTYFYHSGVDKFKHEEVGFKRIKVIETKKWNLNERIIAILRNEKNSLTLNQVFIRLNEIEPFEKSEKRKAIQSISAVLGYLSKKEKINKMKIDNDSSWYFEINPTYKETTK